MMDVNFDLFVFKVLYQKFNVKFENNSVLQNVQVVNRSEIHIYFLYILILQLLISWEELMKREKAPKVENLNQVSVGVNEMLSIIAKTNRLTLILKLNLEILSFQLQVPNN